MYNQQYDMWVCSENLGMPATLRFFHTENYDTQLIRIYKYVDFGLQHVQSHPDTN